MKKTINNDNSYAIPNQRTRTLIVEFVTDMVPGAWHEPEDLMSWIASHSYVKSVTLNDVGDKT